MAKLKFEAALSRQLMLHAWNAPEHNKTFGQKTAKAALWLVKDDGVYIMSNGKPGIPAPLPNRPDRQLVCYAKGYNPETDGDVWDKCRAAMGGDDGCDFLDITKEMIADLSRDDFEGLLITVTQRQLMLEMVFSRVTTSRKRLTEFLAPKVSDANTFWWLGIKKGDRKLKFWQSPKVIAKGGGTVNLAAMTPDSFSKMKASQYREFRLLSGLTVPDAVEAYAEAHGYTLKD